LHMAKQISQDEFQRDYKGLQASQIKKFLPTLSLPLLRNLKDAIEAEIIDRERTGEIPDSGDDSDSPKTD